MTILRKFITLVDTISEKSGQFAKWFALLLVFVGSYDTIVRHFFNSPTIWAYEVLCMAGGVVYMLGASYVYLHDSHTRVDVIYGFLSQRAKSIVNIVASLLFFFPLMIAMLMQAISWAIRSWRIDEVMFSSFWYPPAGPYRTVFAIGLLFLVLQGVSRFIRDVYYLVKGESID